MTVVCLLEQLLWALLRSSTRDKMDFGRGRCPGGQLVNWRSVTILVTPPIPPSISSLLSVISLWTLSCAVGRCKALCMLCIKKSSILVYFNKKNSWRWLQLNFFHPYLPSSTTPWYFRRLSLPQQSVARSSGCSPVSGWGVTQTNEKCLRLQ